jgi:hypothetical protein
MKRVLTPDVETKPDFLYPWPVCVCVCRFHSMRLLQLRRYSSVSVVTKLCGRRPEFLFPTASGIVRSTASMPSLGPAVPSVQLHYWLLNKGLAILMSSLSAEMFNP